MALRFEKEQILTLKHKRNTGGKTCLKEYTTPLCYAVPLLWKEILPFYYAENVFFIRVTTADQRDAFRTWVQQRGKLLEGMKSIKLPFKVSVWDERSGRDEKWIDNVGCYLHVTLTPTEAVSIRQTFSNLKTLMVRSTCACWLLESVETAELKAMPTQMTGAHGYDVCEVNPVIKFATKFSRVLDNSGSRFKAFRRLDSHVVAAQATCPRCNACIETELFS